MIQILLTSNGRPYMEEAIESVLAQTSWRWRLTIMDSGKSALSQELCDKYHAHPKIDWHFTGEPDNLAEKKCPVAWVFNKAYLWGLFNQEYFCCHYDDDLYYPNFIQTMYDYLDSHNIMALRCSQRRSQLYSDGSKGETPPLLADKILTPEDNHKCVYDGQQVVMRTSVLDQIFRKYRSIIPEEPETCSHSDGLFFERAKEFIPELHFIEDTLCEHRNTPSSTYTPTL